jgi:phage-related protein (TIGR01555 family)
MSKKIWDSYSNLYKKINTQEGAIRGITGDSRDEGLMRNIIEIPVDDALREDIISKNDNCIKEYIDLKSEIRGALIKMREEGGVYIIPAYRKAVSWDNVSALNIDINPLSKTYLEPLNISVNNASADIKIEEFKLFKLSASEQYYMSYIKGVSIIERVENALKRYWASINNSTDILSQLNQDVLRIEGLNEKLLDEDRGVDKVLERLKVIALLKSNLSVLALDKEDEYVSVNKTLSGADKVVYYNALNVCSVAKIPYSRLFGKGATGLNNTGEQDLITYYDTVVASLRHTIQAMFNYLTGDKYKDEYSFKPLYTKDEKIVAETYRINVESALKLVENDLLTEDEIEPLIRINNVS